MQRRAYLNFEIQISGLMGGYRVRVLDSPAGQAVADFASAPSLRGFTLPAGRFGPETLQQDGNYTNGKLKTLGTALFETLFHNDVLVCFAQSLLEARNQGAGLRIKMRLNEAPELAALPWEFLYCPALERFLALSAETPLVHYLELARKTSPIVVSLPLRVLVVIASPANLAPLDTQDEWNGIQQSLADLVQQDAIVLDLVKDATLDALRAALRKQEYHILHFIGHGGFLPACQTGALMFHGEGGEADPVSSDELAVVLGDTRSLRLAVLNACEGARTSASNIFSGAAQALVQQGIPAVIAMQSQVSDSAAVTFTHEFYAALVDNLPVDAALAEARKAIYTQVKSDEWGIPRLVMHASDGVLWDIEEVAPAPSPLYVQRLGAELDVLANLVKLPEVRNLAVAFRTDFEAASAQIELLGNYKDLHDLLHNLQFLCYNGLVQEAKRFPADEMTLGILMDHELTLQDYVCRLQEVASRPAMPAGELAWTQELVQAQREIHQAIERLDAVPLKRAIWLIKRVLDRHPTRINERLNAAARALRLDTIERAMLAMREELLRLQPSPAPIQHLDDGIQALGILNRHLSALVDDHDQWQSIDLELRRIEAVMHHDLAELELSWPDLKTRMQPLVLECNGQWAEMIHRDGDQLEQALGNRNPVKIQMYFQRFRRQVGNRFYQVDTELKTLCDQLRIVGQPLAVTFRMLA